MAADESAHRPQMDDVDEYDTPKLRCEFSQRIFERQTGTEDKGTTATSTVGDRLAYGVMAAVNMVLPRRPASLGPALQGNGGGEMSAPAGVWRTGGDDPG